MPLWAIQMFFSQSEWGCELLIDGFPCVAHLVWPMAIVQATTESAISISRFLIFPTDLKILYFPPFSEFLLSNTKLPDESYPRYSRRLSPSKTTGSAEIGRASCRERV